MEHGTIAKVTSSGQFDDDPLKVAWKIDEMITVRGVLSSEMSRVSSSSSSLVANAIGDKLRLARTTTTILNRNPISSGKTRRSEEETTTDGFIDQG